MESPPKTIIMNEEDSKKTSAAPVPTEHAPQPDIRSHDALPEQTPSFLLEKKSPEFREQRQDQVPIERAQEKMDDIIKLNDVFEIRLRAKWENLSPESRNDLQRRIMSLIWTRFGKYNNAKYMGFPETGGRPRGTFVDANMLVELDAIKNEMQTLLEDVERFSVKENLYGERTSEIPAEEEKNPQEIPVSPHDPETEEKMENPSQAFKKHKESLSIADTELLGKLKTAEQKGGAFAEFSTDINNRARELMRSHKLLGWIPALGGTLLLDIPSQIARGYYAAKAAYYRGKISDAASPEIQSVVQEVENEPETKFSENKEAVTDTPKTEIENPTSHENVLESSSISIGKEDAQNPGRENQDALLERADKGVYAVFDGVGGEKHGERASNLAREIINAECDALLEKVSVEEGEKFAHAALQKANQAILEERKKTESGMASTATLAVVCYDPEGKRKLAIANAGDSRAYLHKKEKLERITIDDDFIRAHAKGGDTQVRKLQKIVDGLNDISEIDSLPNLSEEERLLLNQTLQNREMITNNLGREQFDVIVTVVDFPPDAKLGLFSDGITSNLLDEEIEAALNRGDDMKSLANAAQRSNKKPDDITAMFIGSRKTA